MKFGKCKPLKIAYARRMRKSPTVAEAHLWEKLRLKKLGHRFRRQAVIFGFIVDFYCPKLRLAIEVDGSWHAGREDYDQMREAKISSAGILILRFTNDEVCEDVDKVAETIASICATRRLTFS